MYFFNYCWWKKSHSQPPGMYPKPCKSWDIYHINWWSPDFWTINSTTTVLGPSFSWQFFLTVHFRRCSIMNPSSAQWWKPHQHFFFLTTQKNMVLRKNKWKHAPSKNTWLGGGFRYVFMFTPIWGRFPIWRSYFFGWVGSTTNQLVVFVAVFGGISFLQVCQLVVHRGALCISVFGGHEGWLGGRILDNKGSLKCWRNPNPWPERLKKVTWGWIQSKIFSWLVVSKILYFHPYLGRWSNLTKNFQMGWNHQLEKYSEMYCD